MQDVFSAGIRKDSQTLNEVIMSVLGKSQLIKLVADATGYTQKQVAEIIDAFFSELLKAIGRGVEVRLTGIFTALVKKRKARTGRNPRTGEVIQIPEKNVPVLKAGKELKDAAEGA